MRLIDADNISFYCNYEGDCTGGIDDCKKCENYICNFRYIQKQPTAYDVDKVIEEFERIRAKETCNKEKCDTKEICRICVVDDAIEIVKQGSVADDVCECRRLKDCKSLFETSCGYIFAREGFKYCPYCGKKIKVVGDRYDD